MHTIRLAVVEDEPAACRHILDYLDRYQHENDVKFTVSTFDDGEKIVENYRPIYDILLLDIEMKHMDGMEAARRIRKLDEGVVIVFITNASQYAINGYEVQALSYLLKPVPYFDFSHELTRSVQMVQQRTDESMLFEIGTQRTRVELKSILYIESIRHTIIVHTVNGKISITSTLKELEEQLGGHDFFRSNSCYLVNLYHVAGVEGQDCVMDNGERLKISRPRKKGFMTALANCINGGRQ
ncbi:two component transcriptional regulator, LytTR family [Bifidobacterium bohemicum]|uniref:Two-component response regulator virR n=1 Tax=Bifidobacterium bohemicum DSM 22767 TaxID=1437606 RepID=A0A086ZEP5_9BIFI|nr:LytTR family DNA-binding domain-containing protein [Bifidobacterium bohemicum]KFI44995.1 Two-component response regulator virR [Bifidobacterium bohemicum DSM 22767]SCC12877.1 two component transcriptional regulator, LytTR family [Bifidobacterium bohemicum]